MALSVAAVAAAFSPGVAMYDTVAQYEQVVSGEVDDWHPPVMVRLWQALEPLGHGTAPMFVLQVALYAAGFALMVAALVQSGRPRSALAAAVLALSPLLLGWQMVVLKDGQMLGALIAAFAIVARYRLAGRRIPPAIVGIVGLLVIYATLVRANAVFATAPLVVLLLPRPASILARGGLALAAILAVIDVSPLINHRLFGASPNGVEKSQPLFDLAAIAVATGSPSPFTADERAQIVRRHCAKAFFWDPLGEPTACAPAAERLQAEPDRALYLDLAHAIVAHPLVYAGHRLRHWNSTERWLVAPGLIDAEPPDEAEPNDDGLASPASGLVPAWQSVASAEAATPLGWPIIWTLVSLLLVPMAWARRAEPAGGLALALVASVATIEASFLIISIASDLRYHLWSIAASGLALILLSDRLWSSRRSWLAGSALLGVVIAAGLWTRATLPRAPDSYQAMIHAPSG